MPTKKVSKKVLAQRKAKVRKANRAKGLKLDDFFPKPIEVVAATPILEVKPVIGEGQQKLINAAKYLVADRLGLAALRPLNGKAINVRNYETLTFMTGTLTEAEKDLTTCVELIGDLLTGREQFSVEDYEQMCLNEEFDYGEGPSAAEVEKINRRFIKQYREVGGGKVRNAGMRPGYDAEELMAQYRRDPEKFRLLKATSNKRFHVVLFGTLYSFVGKKKAQAAFAGRTV
jgi:hypothetical protein